MLRKKTPPVCFTIEAETGGLLLDGTAVSDGWFIVSRHGEGEPLPGRIERSAQGEWMLSREEFIGHSYLDLPLASGFIEEIVVLAVDADSPPRLAHERTEENGELQKSVPHPKGYRHRKNNTERDRLPDGSGYGDYYCPHCPLRWLSEDTVVWAVRCHFGKEQTMRGHNQKHEGDVIVFDSDSRRTWIIEAKGQTPAEDNVGIDFQTALGQILIARGKSGPSLLYAIALPDVPAFTQQTTLVDKKDRQALCLHWIWVNEERQVQIDCPMGVTCSCRQYSKENLGSYDGEEEGQPARDWQGSGA